jgi:hypothetical protein
LNYNPHVEATAGGCGKNRFLEKYWFEDSKQTGSKVRSTVVHTEQSTVLRVHLHIRERCIIIHCFWKLPGHTVTKWYIFISYKSISRKFKKSYIRPNQSCKDGQKNRPPRFFSAQLHFWVGRLVQTYAIF